MITSGSPKTSFQKDIGSLHQDLEATWNLMNLRAGDVNLCPNGILSIFVWEVGEQFAPGQALRIDLQGCQWLLGQIVTHDFQEVCDEVLPVGAIMKL